MKSKETPFRPVGQRSIASSFLSPSSNTFRVSKEVTQKESSEKGFRLSFSDFLQRKLNEASGLPRTVKGKSKPFSSLLGQRELSGSRCIDEQAEAKKGGEADANSVVEKVVLEQFKHSGIAKEDCVGASSVGEVESCDIADVQGSRKRKNLEGGDERRIRRKHFAVLGRGLKLKQQERVERLTSKENQVTAYNHADANGGGWWDSNMEEVDNEEVGSSELWEGVGSTTFGGIIDWH